jgi:signal transduction histidine kinase
LDPAQELILRSAPTQPVTDERGRMIAEVYGIQLPPSAPADPVPVLAREMWLAILCALLAALAAAVIVARHILAPVRSLSEAAAAMHAGDLSRRVNAGGPAEITQLADRFNALAAHLERSEALRQRMIADIAHELRTPLTNIRGMIEAVEDGHMPANERTMASLSEEAYFLERLVNDLQDLSLADAGQIRFEIGEVSAGESARAVVAALEPSARIKGIRVSVDVETNRDSVRADEARLRQIIAILLSNAIRLAPERSAIRIPIAAGPGSVQISVCDQGPGLSVQALGAAFERFYRADESRSRQSGGAGLGLAIAKQLVEAQGGSIGVTNNAGAGATFSFTLPAY